MLTSRIMYITALLIGASLLLWNGCGIGEISDEDLWDDDDDERQTMFKHPPPPGPAPWTYYLTSYGGYSDKSAYNGKPACGGSRVNGKWWYSTGAWSFTCFARLELRANGKCAVVKVVDNGPAGWVESKAKAKCGGSGYIIDASPLVTKHLYGKSGSGWSDCLKIQVRPVAGNTPTGPCSGSAPSPPPANCHKGQTFGWEYCSPSCLCDEGMGDCDADADCKSGLRCAHNTGAKYGAGGTVDVCEAAPGSGGGSGGGTSYGDCFYAGERGTCQPDNQPCSGGYRGSLCPGGNNIRCCLPTWGSCSSGGKTGTCQLTTKSCASGYKSGLCPGPSDVKCCL